MCSNAQGPVNDNCSNAIEIGISQNGYGYGTYNTSPIDIVYATKEKGEICHTLLDETGNCSKTVWYKFYIGSTRNVSIELKQSDSSIPRIFSGFNVYSVSDCNYSAQKLSNEIPPLNQFGLSGNQCLRKGWYYVQVGCKNKAKGNLWIELKSKSPNAIQGDEYSDPVVIKMGTSEIKYQSLFFNCSGIDTMEALTDARNYESSMWLKIHFNPNFDVKYIKNSYNNNFQIAYRLFFDTLTTDSVISNKPFNTIKDKTYFGEDCGQHQVVYMQVLGQHPYLSVNMEISQKKTLKDSWASGRTAHQFVINSQAINTLHQFNCDADLSQHICKQVIPKLYELKNFKFNSSTSKYEYIDDTFKYAGYTVFESLTDGLLNVSSSSGGNNHFTGYALYEGNIRNNCQLTQLTDSVVMSNYSNGFQYCIESGKTYTMILLSEDLSLTEIASRFEVTKHNNTVLYYDYRNPEPLRNFNPLKDQAFSSQKVSFDSYSDTIKVDSVTVSGYLSYKEIYISETSSLNISGASCYLSLFGGRLSNGTAHLLDNIDYRNTVSSFGLSKSLFGSFGDCFTLNKGYYTIVCHYTNINNAQMECSNRKFWVNFIPNTSCPAPNNIEPMLALPVNGHQDVLSATDKLIGFNYVHEVKFCKDCISTSVTKPYVSCYNAQKLNGNENYAYYTFYLGNDASLSLFTEASQVENFELFEGDVRLNPAVVQNEIYQIGKCAKGNTICHLKGQKYYTLVLIIQSKVGNVNLVFTPFLKTPNDYLSSSIDLGHINSNAKIQSVYSNLTCHTSENPIESKSNSAKYNVSFPDTLNKRRTIKPKSLYYTFTTNNSGKIKLTPESTSKYTSIQQIKVYKCLWNFDLDFNLALAKNPDTSINGLKKIDVIISNPPEVIFMNEGCSMSRYIVEVITTNTSNINIRLNLDYTIETGLVTGDQCSNAIEANLNNTGTQQLDVNINCHTYGGSVFESSSALGLKTSWIKLKVDNISKFDLEIKMIKGNPISHFNFYGGNCGAMTKITEVRQSNSYFKIGCLGPGEYWLQVYTKDQKTDLLTFEFTTTNSTELNCKPFEFKQPIALFKLNGGCHTTDTVFCINQSTQGEDMTYDWYLNGRWQKQGLSYQFDRNMGSLSDSNVIRLIAENTITNLKDTFETYYLRDIKRYNFEFTGPKVVKCNEKPIFKVNTDFNEKLNHVWLYVSNGKENELSKAEAYQFGGSEGLYIVKATSDNCEFIDSLQIRIIKSLGIYKDTVLCDGQKLSVVNTTNETMVINQKALYSGESIEISKPNQYMIYYTKDDCVYNDTFDLRRDDGPRIITRSDFVYQCNVDSLVLTNSNNKLKSYLWNDGSKDSNLTVKKSGVYTLRGPLSTCKTMNHTYNVVIELLKTELLRDTIMCRYSDYYSINPFGNLFKVKSAEPNIGKHIVDEPFRQIIEVERGLCNIKDTSYIDVYSNRNSVKDTMYCEVGLSFSFVLDGGNQFKTHHWYSYNFKGQYYEAKDYGTYKVARTDNNQCHDTLTWSLINNCTFNVFVPTSFSPNKDKINDIFDCGISGRFNEVEMKIFNRWGEQLFEGEKWDGTFEGELVAQGVYLYWITVEDIEGKMHHFRGTVTLIR